METDAVEGLVHWINSEGRYVHPRDIGELASHAGHPSVAVRSELIESLMLLDLPEADQWIVAIGVEEDDERVQRSVCRAAKFNSIVALTNVLTRWSLAEQSTDSLRDAAIEALAHMQQRSALAEIIEKRADLAAPQRDWLRAVVSSVPAGRSDRDHMMRSPHFADSEAVFSDWTLWHDDGTRTELLDDGAVVGPDFRFRPTVPSFSWWPSNVERQVRFPLRRELIRLDRTVANLELEAPVVIARALETTAAPAFICTILPWMDDVLPFLYPLLESSDPALRAAAWREASEFREASGLQVREHLQSIAVDSLATETEPGVRHMLVWSLRKSGDPRCVAAVRASLLSGDHVERLMACVVAAGLGPGLEPSIKEVAHNDPSPILRDCARKLSRLD